MPVLGYPRAHMAFSLSLAPILFILALMAGLRWSAARAGGAGYLLAPLIATASFGAGVELLAYAGLLVLLISALTCLAVWIS
ncbi:MAG: hypothetical protein PHD58_06860 [Anaerolineales bacterium]|nr:hypothetical protein [Anaerolineales bacterium]